MDINYKIDRKGYLMPPQDLTAEQKEEIRAIFRWCSGPRMRYHFSEEAIDNFIAELGRELLVVFIILVCSRPNLLDKKKKMLCALEEAIVCHEEIIRLEIAPGDRLSPSVFSNLDPACRIEQAKHSQVYGPLYRLRDKIQEERANPKRGRLPTPEVCLHFIRRIAEMFERHLGYPARMYYPEGPFVQIVVVSLRAIGYPISDPRHLFDRLQKESPAEG